MNTSIIVQARMTSTRLPGKILKTVLNKPLLEFQIERLKKVHNINDVIIATTTNSTDDIIVEFCKNLNIKYFRGSEDDVLERYYLCALEYKVDNVVRVTSDCPLIDFQVIENAIELFIQNLGQVDYLSNCLVRTYPRGLDCEVFSFRVLKESFENAVEKPEREHVTPYIYHNRDKYNLMDLTNDTDYSHYRLTVDTPKDFELIHNILEALYPNNPDFVLHDVIEILKKNPEWEKINAEIKQKIYGQ